MTDNHPSGMMPVLQLALKAARDLGNGELTEFPMALLDEIQSFNNHSQSLEWIRELGGTQAEWTGTLMRVDTTRFGRTAWVHIDNTPHDSTVAVPYDKLTRYKGERVFIDELPIDHPVSQPIAPDCDFLCSLVEQEFANLEN